MITAVACPFVHGRLHGHALRRVALEDDDGDVALRQAAITGGGDGDAA